MNTYTVHSTHKYKKRETQEKTKQNKGQSTETAQGTLYKILYKQYTKHNTTNTQHIISWSITV